MAEKEKAGKPAAKKPASGKPAAKKKPAAGKQAAKKKPAAAEKSAATEEMEAAAERAQTSEDTGPAEKEGTRATPGAEEEMSEEEFRRLVEESLEKATVADIVLTIMNQMASLAYLKMGIPESVNLKYRDFEQAALAIDALEGLIKGTESRIPQEALRPFRGTLANLQMNYVQLVRRSGGD